MQTKDVLDAMAVAKLEEEMFFRLAHIFCFGSDANVATDVAQFKMHAVVPPYALTYARVVLETTV